MAHQEQHDGGTDSRLGTAFSTFTLLLACSARWTRAGVSRSVRRGLTTKRAAQLGQRM